MRTGNSRHPIDEDLSMGTPAGNRERFVLLHSLRNAGRMGHGVLGGRVLRENR
jgi:hypothetical protein